MIVVIAACGMWSNRVSGGPTSSAILTPLPNDGIASGVDALYVAAKLLGIHVDINVLAERAQLSPRGVSLENLREAAIMSGLYPMTYNGGDQGWGSIPPHSIIEIGQQRYAFVIATGRNGVDAIEGSKRRLISPSEIEKLWTHTIIEIRSRPEVAAGKPNTLSITDANLKAPDVPLLFNDEDLGDIPGDTEISREYVLVNESASSLKLDAILPSCGCTTTRTTNSEMKPRGEIRIFVSLNTRGLSGAVEKNVLFKMVSAEGSKLKVMCKVHGKVVGEQRLYSQPPEPLIDVVSGETAHPLVIFVSREADTPVRFVRVRASSPMVKVAPIDVTHELDKRIRLQMELVGQPKSDTSGTIFVETTGAFYKVLEIPFRVHVLPSVIAQPSAIFEPKLTFGKVADFDIVLRSAMGRNLSIASVTLEPQWLGSFIPQEPATGPNLKIKIRIKAPARSTAEPIVQGSLHVKTENGDELILPVSMRCVDPSE
jgi:hypothetical protein